MLLHELNDFADLIAVTAREQKIDPGLVEKDYWIMHCLWGLQQLGFAFELKGGTSLSKGFRLIDRFSEDIDILIHPDSDLKYGPNHNKPPQVAARKAFYDELAQRIEIPGITSVDRDAAFDDTRYYRSAGIRLVYTEVNRIPDGVKDGILLEVGFDQVAPNRAQTIASWAFDKALTSGLGDLTDNRAQNVLCYEPGYTLVEKLQTISTKFRIQQETRDMPVNFMRHYYDVYCLLQDDTVQEFIGSDAYNTHKAKRFRTADNPDLTSNEAFVLSDKTTRKLYAEAYRASHALYYREQPEFGAILTRLGEHLSRL
tara:strand:+ start:5274 stop:6212 length:939 start_codon:yes stop_codon:yes gene_type:complete